MLMSAPVKAVEVVAELEPAPARAGEQVQLTLRVTSRSRQQVSVEDLGLGKFTLVSTGGTSSSTRMTFSSGSAQGHPLQRFTRYVSKTRTRRRGPLGPVVPGRHSGGAIGAGSGSCDRCCACRLHSALRAICSWISRCSPRSLMSGSSLPSRRMFTAGSGSRGSPSSTTPRRQASGGSRLDNPARAAGWSCTPGVGSAGI